MCGIGGFFLSCNLSLEDKTLTKILNDIDHRGPDDKGLYKSIDSRVGLVHTRLSIQDLSSLGHQPMISRDQKVVLVFNGEIYNFKELRSELFLKGVHFNGNSDTEVLLNLYLLEGKAMLSRLNGIFAFAIWDQRDKSLFIARDNFGVKPIYYAELNKSFFFASELKALVPILKGSNQLNNEAIALYLSYLWCPGKQTPIKIINKVLPGEAKIIKDGVIEESWKWYHPKIFQKKSKILMRPEEAVKGTLKHLRNAVNRQMVADVPVGAFLSGGLDSSAIVALAREQNKNIRCFTIETEGNQDKGLIDDLPYAKKVSKHLDVPLDIVKINSSKMANDLEKMIKMLDEPVADPAALNVFYISQLARQQGIKVLLSGAGGDDLFTGYRRHFALMHEHWWNWIPLKVRNILYKSSTKLNQNNSFFRRISKLFSGINLEGDERLVNYFKWIRREDIQRLYSSEFSHAIKNTNTDTVMLNFLKSLPLETNKLDKMLALEQQFFLADHNLIYTDKMSMAAGVEVRVPFLDKDLVEFAYNIPNQFKQKGIQGKWVLKKALEGHLPSKIIYRPKSGFGAPIRRWIQNELSEIIGDLLSIESLRNRGLFNPTAVQKLISDNSKGKIDASYTILSLLCIEIWCRNFIKN